MLKIFIHGGGSSPYDKIAVQYGWKIGMNSGGKSNARQPLFMIDNNWRHYDHNDHLSLIINHKPHLATVRDIETHCNQLEILEQALEIAEYCDRVVVIPKTTIIHPDFFRLKKICLGLPLGSCENNVSWQYAKEKDLPVHLLGGSPLHHQYAKDLLGEKVYSCDGNYLSKISRYGKIYKNFKTRKPHRWEVEDGKDFCYRCFDFSLKNLPDEKFFKQLSLF